MFGLAPPWWASGATTLTPQGWDPSTVVTSGVIGTWGIVLSGGNSIATYSQSASASGRARGYRPRKSGKYYFEVTFTRTSGSTNDIKIGWADEVYFSSDFQGSFYVNGLSGTLYYGRIGGGNDSQPVPSVTSGSTTRIAVDIDADKIWVAVNGGAFYGGGDPAAGTSPTMSTANTTPSFSIRSGRPFFTAGGSGGLQHVFQLHAATSELVYGAPSGFQAWGDPDDTVNDA